MEIFLGIPYAKFVEPFEKAEYPHPSWSDTFFATKYPDQCWQNDSIYHQYKTTNSHDCLSISVYVPRGVRSIR